MIFSEQIFHSIYIKILRKLFFVLQKGNVDVEEEEISGVIAGQNREAAWEHWKNGILMFLVVAYVLLHFSF